MRHLSGSVCVCGLKKKFCRQNKFQTDFLFCSVQILAHSRGTDGNKQVQMLQMFGLIDRAKYQA